jgi:PIN domain nuclease of toxin-antitoxin system
LGSGHQGKPRQVSAERVVRAVLDGWYPAGIIENDFRVLPITVAHASTLVSLPMHHKDPFDRMIISQAISEQIPVVSADSAYGLYDLERIW